MDARRSSSRGWLILVAGLTCAVLTVAWLPSQTQAAPPVLPTRPAPHAAGPASGAARIVLRVQFPEAGLGFAWQELKAVVQWQDALGSWHDVEEWQGPLDEAGEEEGRKEHGVLQKDFGTGPFRWVVYRAQGGAALGVSAPFHLPPAAGEKVQVGVSLEPPLLPAAGRAPGFEPRLLVAGGLVLLGVLLTIAGRRLSRRPH